MSSIEVFLAAIIGLGIFVYYLREYFQGGQFKQPSIRLNDKVVIVTGSNTGIGKETALDLAKRGATVYMACRDQKTGEAARREIIELTSNQNVFNWPLDLASLDSVRDFAKRFIAEQPRLDILINNAGVMNVPQSKTKDGFEMHIGVNHLGHFLLTNLLLDRLRSSAPSRIVNVASSAHKFTRINKADIMRSQSYNCWTAYCQSKLANILFTRQLAKILQGSNVTANSLHPGVVATDLMRHSPLLVFFTLPIQMFYKTCRSGAQTTLMLAVDPNVATVSGKYFSDCDVMEPAWAAQDDETAEWLWRESEKYTDLGKMNFKEEITRKYFEGPMYDNIGIFIPRRIVVITECSTGIGKETALEMAKRGAHVYMACKDISKCEEVRKEIVQITSNRSVFCRELNLASLNSVRGFAKRFLEEEPKIDVLINNASVISEHYAKTPDGFEMHFGVNYLGHFLLTNLFLGAIKNAAPSRIITLTNATHRWTSLDKSDLMSERKPYSWKRSFNQSQLANILFNRQLAALLTGTRVTANCVHPGFVWNSTLCNMLGSYKWPLAFFMKTLRTGAQTTVAAVLNPRFRKVSGRYMVDCSLAKEASCAKDDADAKWLWRTSERLTGLEKVSFENEQTRC